MYLNFRIHHFLFQLAGSESAPIEIHGPFVKKWNFFEVEVGLLEVFCQGLEGQEREDEG